MNITGETLIIFILPGALGRFAARRMRKRGRIVHRARDLAEILTLGVILIALFLAIWALAFERGGYRWVIVGIYFFLGLFVGERMKKPEDLDGFSAEFREHVSHAFTPRRRYAN